MDSDRDDEIFDDDLDILEIIDLGFPRLTYTRSDQFHEFDDGSFRKRFRLSKATTLHLLTLIENQLEYPGNMNNSVSPMNQLLTALRFYASAGHLTAIADYMRMHTLTASRIVKKVTEAIAELYGRYINMPHTENDIRSVQNKFYRIARFPRTSIPGCDDGEIFRNRKSYFSINIQAVCGANLKIVDVVARWPGSTHDATVFMNSDSGYPIKNYFLTPLSNPNNRQERLYNESHIRSRNVVERLFGVWKRRFPILAYGIRLKLDTAMAVIVATAVLHNIALEINEELPPCPNDLERENLKNLIENGQINYIHNEEIRLDHVRRDLINNYFANL
ncbi:hypothetical protein RN001_002197 [Aquatica leii]|uniref:DDE Tnp4 domain-containing protein n=1 Tax=Aquatica leii TaxID=1421715 RepID=A0AAN7PM38_9COLE|nr:hypothetical protein RN001_002197 [Aquatica leii]